MAAFITPIASIAAKILDRVIPDKAANDAAKNQLAQMALSGEIAELTGQIDVNKIEAAGGWWTSGARPAIMWVFAAGLGVDIILRPIIIWFCNLIGHPTDFPELDVNQLWPMISGILGLGATHAWENIQTKKVNAQ